MADTVQKRVIPNPWPQSAHATEWLVNSYVFFAIPVRLRGALVAARKAVEQSPDFGFAWPGGGTWNSVSAHGRGFHGPLDWALLFPAQCQAWVLKGFLACEQLQCAGRAGR